MMAGSAGPQGGESLLFLTDEQLRKGIEAMFFAYRAFTAAPDRILENYDYGRAHHRSIHFIHRQPGLTVNALLGTLGVTKQSLNRVLRTLVADGLVVARVGRRDKRERNLFLTAKGAELERDLSDAQRARMRAAYRAAAAPGSGDQWQALTDPALLRVTELEIRHEADRVDLLAQCPSDHCPDPADPDCPPRLLIHRVTLTIEASDVRDPTVRRRLRNTLRLRNEELQGACPAL